MNLLCAIGLLGLSRSRLEQGPLSGWRRPLQVAVWAMTRGIFFCMGIHWLTVKGKQVSLTIRILRQECQFGLF